MAPSRQMTVFTKTQNTKSPLGPKYCQLIDTPSTADAPIMASASDML